MLQDLTEENKNETIQNITNENQGVESQNPIRKLWS